MTEEEKAAAAAAAAKAAEEAAAAEAAKRTADEAAAAEAAKKAAEEAAKNAKPGDDSTLLKELMKLKEKYRDLEVRHKTYEGLDAEAARAAIAKAKEDEKKELERRGEYDRIVKQVADEADAKVKAAEAQAADLNKQIADLRNGIEEKDTANKFLNSRFVTDNLAISGDKVRVLYGDHFDRVDGEIVAYDKPRGAGDRTPLVDSAGKKLSFEAAIEKIVKADPEFDRIAKSTLRKGAGSSSANLPGHQENKPVSARDRIKAGIAAGGLKTGSLNLKNQK